MSEFAYRQLGEHPVYPGHPLTTALLILLRYADNIDAAFAKGQEYPNALESHHIPGAGGEVYAALDMIRRIRDGADVEATIADRDAWWASYPYRAGGHHDNVVPGQEQADRFKDRFRAEVAKMLRATGVAR